jgi:ribosome maturation factor RimP
MGWAQLIFFWFCAKDEREMKGKLSELLSKTLPPMGYELVDWEMSGRGGMLRVFIDKLTVGNGVGNERAGARISVDDCARVSHHLTRLFAVENIEYERLEVSSPGLDRPLTKLADYARFSGEEAQVHLHELTDGVRRLKGILRGIEGDSVLVETETGVRTIPFAVIDRGRLVPKIEWRKAK